MPQRCNSLVVIPTVSRIGPQRLTLRERQRSTLLCRLCHCMHYHSSVISVLYSIIIAKVWGRHIPGNTTPANVRLLNKSKKNVLKMLITVVLVFAFCWFLLHLNVFLQEFSDVFYRLLWHTSGATDHWFFVWTRKQCHQLLHLRHIQPRFPTGI